MSALRESRAPLVGIYLVSAVACGFLFWLLYLREGHRDVAESLRFLPGLNASFNAASAACLVLGYRAIRQRQVETHRRFMMAAFGLSALFLVGYITHHALHGDTKFVGEGPIRAVYLAVLASHVVLSVVALPMVLTTFFFSLSGQFERHRRWARLTLPIWLYVSVTGVLVFAMLSTLSG